MEKGYTIMLQTALDKVFDVVSSVLVPTSSLVISGEDEPTSDEIGRVLAVALLTAAVCVIWLLREKSAQGAG
jgi:hypothetical protein